MELLDIPHAKVEIIIKFLMALVCELEKVGTVCEIRFNVDARFW